MRASGAQIGEGVKEARLHTHVPQQVGDADTRHQGVDGVIEASGGVGRDRIVRCDLEAAAFEANAFEMAVDELFPHLVQALAQRLAAACQPRWSIGRESAVGKHLPRLVQGWQVGVEAAVIAAAFHPHVAGAKPVAQGGDDCRLVDAPLRPPVFQDHGLPVLAGKGHRHDVGQVALAGAVVFLQEFQRCLQVLPGLRHLEVKSFQERRRKAPQLGVASCRQGQGVFRRQVPKGSNLFTRPEQAVPADLCIEDGERVLLVLAGAHHGVKGAAEEPDQPADLRLAGRPGAFLPVLGASEQKACQTLEHGDRGIGQHRVQFRHLGSQSGDTAALAEITEQVDRGNGAFPGEPGQPSRVNIVAQLCRQPEVSHELQPVQESAEARRAGGMRQSAQPGQPRLAESGVMPEQIAQGALVAFIQGVVEGLCRKTPGTGASGEADAFQPDGARQHVAQGFQVADQPLQDEASVIGIECRPGGESDGSGHVVARHERLESKVAHCQLPVAGTRRVPDAVAGQSRYRYGDLLGKPEQDRAGHVRITKPVLTRMAQKSDMDSQAEPVGGASARADEFQVFIGQDVIALQ